MLTFDLPMLTFDLPKRSVLQKEENLGRSKVTTFHERWWPLTYLGLLSAEPSVFCPHKICQIWPQVAPQNHINMKLASFLQKEAFFPHPNVAKFDLKLPPKTLKTWIWPPFCRKKRFFPPQTSVHFDHLHVFSTLIRNRLVTPRLLLSQLFLLSFYLQFWLSSSA